MKLKIAVAFGGRSVEHEISVLSAQQVIAALDEERYEILPLYIAKDGRMFCEEELRELETFQHIEEFIADHTSVALLRREAHTYLIPIAACTPADKEVDMVFPEHCMEPMGRMVLPRISENDRSASMSAAVFWQEQSAIR